MNTFLRASVAFATGAASLSIACAALAQQPSPPPPGGPPTAEQRQAWMQHRQESMQQSQQEMTQRLTAVLNLRPDQQSALQTMEAALGPQAHERHEHRDRAAGPVPTPERLDRMTERMAKRDADFHRKADAIKAFYAVLSPEQQRAFDALPLPGAGEHRGHGPMGRDHGGPMDRGGPQPG